MQFSATETNFLAGPLGRTEARGKHGYPALPDGMPEHAFQRALEYRAKRMGSIFTEFRNRCQQRTTEIVDGLEQRIRASKLY